MDTLARTASVTLHEGDCLDILATLPENSVDAVVTDPPYHLHSGKPMSVGFNHKRNGDGTYRTHMPSYTQRGFMNSVWDSGDVSFRKETWAEVLRVLKPGGHILAFSGTRTYHRMATAIEDAGFEIRDQIGWLFATGFPKTRNHLKPAWEPICLARKPLIGTVAANIAEYGTGGLNIDDCRVGRREHPSVTGARTKTHVYSGQSDPGGRRLPEGRWPANTLHDGSDEVLESFAEYGQKPTGNLDRSRITAENKIFGNRPKTLVGLHEGDTGTAARYFYCAKASAKERAGSKHPTVKPLSLMKYLCRLITPPGGIVLDPFAGTGTTGQAALDEGFSAILIEREAEYCQDIKRRLSL